MDQVNKSQHQWMWLIGVLVSLTVQVQAQHIEPSQEVPREDLSYWVHRIETAAREQNYTGTYIISQPDHLMMLRTVHQYQDGVEYELVDALNESDRHVFRENADFYAVFPQTRELFVERQSITQLFPSLVRARDSEPERYYELLILGNERFLNRNTNVVQFMPKDHLRYGYTAWIDEETGLLLRVEIKDVYGTTLERAAFTDINWIQPDTPGRNELHQYLSTLYEQGYQQKEWDFTRVSLIDTGWTMASVPTGFYVNNCVLRHLVTSSKELLQCVYSDGIVSVSIFIEPELQVPDNVQEDVYIYRYGATGSLTYFYDRWKVTIVGELPDKTLEQFALALERLPAGAEN